MDKIKTLILMVAVGSLTACAGLEIGGKAGIYAVDERQETQTTASRMRPLKCLFVKCETETYPQGS